MEFPYDYIILSAVPAFCVGFCAGAFVTRWLYERIGKGGEE